MKKGDIVISTVLYIALGIILTAILIAASIPVINKLKDRNTIENMKQTLQDINGDINEVGKEGIGAQRSIDINIVDGSLIIDPDQDTISWSIETKAILSEPDVVIKEGNIEILTKNINKKNVYSYIIILRYTGIADMILSGDSRLIGKHNLIIKNTGMLSELPIIEIKNIAVTTTTQPISTSQSTSTTTTSTSTPTTSIQVNNSQIIFILTKKEYFPDEFLKGAVIFINNLTTTVSTQLVIELFKNDALFSKAETQYDVQPGISQFPIASFISSSFPDDPSYSGNWKLRFSLKSSLFYPNEAEDSLILKQIPDPIAITIQGSQDKGNVKLINGFLGFIDINKNPEAKPLIAGLKPKYWRGGFDMNDYKTNFGSQIELVFPDYYQKNIGALTPWENWQEYESNVRAIVNYFENTQNKHIDYWDLGSEPDNFWPKDRQPELTEYFKRTYNAIRSVDPNAKIVGPSIASFNEEYLKDLFTNLTNENIYYNGISWHEFRLPEDLPPQVQVMRDFFSQKGLAIPEIHINEYSSGQNHLIPGWAVGWLYYMEKANLEVAIRACWEIEGEPPGLIDSSECVHGIDGMFMKDDKSPQPLYWVYYMRAQMENQKNLVSDTDYPRVIALASKNDLSQKVSILVGRYSCGKTSLWCKFDDHIIHDMKNPNHNVLITIKNYPYANSGNNVQAQFALVPNSNLSAYMSYPVILPTQTFTISSNGDLLLPINSFVDGDAYYVVIS